jgi:hypothetical protein
MDRVSSNIIINDFNKEKEKQKKRRNRCVAVEGKIVNTVDKPQKERKRKSK